MAKKKILNAVLILIMLSGLGGTGYLLYVKTTLDAEIISLNNEIDRGNSLLRAAKKKYTQEKAKLGTCMRAKMAEEIKNARMKKDIADLEVQKAEFQNQLEGLEKKT